MIGSRQLERLLREAKNAKAKIVLVGDPYQLQAIEAGAAFRAISEETPTVSITEIRRQKIDWQREATIDLATGKTWEAIARYSTHDHVHNFETQVFAQDGLVQLWNDARISQPDKTQIILSYTRDDVKALNELAREKRKAQNELGDDHAFITARGERLFTEGDRIYFLKNDRDLQVKNGTLGTIQRLHGNMLTVILDKIEGQKTPKTITFSTDRYNDLDHGYAATIHKSQGVTVDRAYVLASKYMDGHATYVGLSRHRESVDIFYSKEEFENEQVLARSLSRERSKDVTLDYTQQKEEVLNQEKECGYTNQQQDKALQTLALQQNAKRLDFSDFKAQFEKQHPEKAKELQDAIRSKHEQLALESETQINLLEKKIKESRISYSSRERLEKYAFDISKQKEVMAYLSEHKKELSEKIHKMAKSRERSLDLDMEIDF
jgi:Ti-type conjugative transfer relaxase TraA